MGRRSAWLVCLCLILLSAGAATGRARTGNPSKVASIPMLIKCLESKGGFACFGQYAPPNIAPKDPACVSKKGPACDGELVWLKQLAPAAAATAAPSVQPASGGAPAPTTPLPQDASSILKSPLCATAKPPNPPGPPVTITLDLLKATLGTAAATPEIVTKLTQYLPYLQAVAQCGQISTCLRVCSWLSQIAHESDGFATLEEYADGSAYERRSDLGNTQPGDGRLFKGRGPIQLTGRTNYEKAGKALGLNLVGDPKMVATPQVGFLTSLWFWLSHDLNSVIDKTKNNVDVTQIVNGGQNGAVSRAAKFGNCRAAAKC